MTFSQTVKNEILKSCMRSVKDCCATAFLTAVLKSAGSLSLSIGGASFAVDGENKEFLQFCGELSAGYFHLPYTLGVSSKNAKGVNVYTLGLDGAVAGKLGFDEQGLFGDVTVPTKPCCKRAFLQALFIASGSVAVPISDNDLGEKINKATYQLEMRFADKSFCQTVKNSYPEIAFHEIERKNCYILYLKDSEQIADFLVSVNAMSAKLKLENIIIGRSMRNTANRQSNCISANIEKSIVASEKQMEAIKKLRSSGKFFSLPQGLIDIALIREEFPEATIDELANKLEISKSGASHRLRKIVELAN